MSQSSEMISSQDVPLGRNARILVCDDEKNMRNLLYDLLIEEGWQVDTAETGEEVLEKLFDSDESYHVLLLDLWLPGIDGVEVIREINKRGIELNIVVITANQTIESAVAAMRAGAADYVIKPFKNERIRGAVRRILASRDLVTQAELSHPTFLGADNKELPIIGQDNLLKSAFNIIRRIADLKTAVLIQGESGTGKELVAQAIHFNGVRRDKPFVAVNCAALPESLLESEFFGHERGAFTGAHALQRGKFELADGGTLFLDEIGEMPVGLQVKLLRVLQDQRFPRVGGEKEISVDVRIIAATNRDLHKAIEDGHFREDLFYRLNVITIPLPPLRERKGDIPNLLEFFIDRFSRRHNLPPLRLTTEILERACEQPWRGNIRELQNAVEKAVIMQDPEILVEPGTMPLGLQTPEGRAARQALETGDEEDEGTRSRDRDVPEHCTLLELGGEGEIRELSEVAADAQRAALIRAIKLCGGNKAEAAKRLGISYKTLYNKIHELGVSISTTVE